jgi:hypothetical protein
MLLILVNIQKKSQVKLLQTMIIQLHMKMVILKDGLLI